MSRIAEKLASFHYTTWNLVVLLLWQVWGMLMAGSEAYKKGFQGMNNVLVRDWLFSKDTGFPVLKVWFVGLCILMILLGINLIFCSWGKIFRVIRTRFNGPKLFMLIVHIIFGLVALGHFGGLMLGYEHNNIQLSEGKTYSFGDGYRIEVKSINFISDYKVLKKTKYITRDEFDYRKNSAEIVLLKNNNELKRGNIYILDPMEYGDLQVTLRNFVLSPESGEGKGIHDQKPWVSITVSKNPVLKLFLFIYPLMIAGIFIHLFLTWRQPTNSNIQQTNLF
jgi:hypothetical protein